MSDPEDRMLELGLERLLGSEQEQPDLAQKIVAAWEAGERRPAPVIRRRLEDEEEQPKSERPLPRLDRRPIPEAKPRRLWIPAAAAAAGLAALGLWSLQDDAPIDDSGTPMARDTNIVILPPELTPYESLRSGKALRVARGPAQRIEWPDGLVATAEPGSTLSMDADGTLLLGGGNATFQTADSAQRVRIPGGGFLEIDAQSEVYSKIRLDRTPEDGQVGLEAWWGNGLAQAHGLLELETRKGGSRVVFAGLALEGSNNPVASLWIEPKAVRTADVLELGLGSAIEDLNGDPQNPDGMMERWGRAGREGPIARLRDDPALWIVAEDAVAKYLVPGALAGYLQEVLVTNLAMDDSPRANALLRQAWQQIPERYSPDVLVAMAERGVPEFVRECEAYLKYWDEEQGEYPYVMAVWSAMNGRGVGALQLADAAMSRQDKVNYFAPSLAAAGLARLGDRATWEELLPLWTDPIEAALLAADINRAEDALIAFEYISSIVNGTPLPGASRPARAGFAQFFMERYRVQRRGSYPDAEALQTRLEELK
ncbi:MAG: hypothetical protein ACI9HE_000020 [Planctomycetota bacterium]|jgi:hypothetical protein